MRSSRYKVLLVAAVILAASAGPGMADELFFSPADTLVSTTAPFFVHVMIDAVDSLMGWDITVELSGDPVIKVLGIAEGTLPGSNGDETFFYRLEQWDLDTFHINGSVLGTVVDGPGILFTLTVQATYPVTPGVAWLDFSYSELRNGVNGSIVHDIVKRARIEVIEPIANEESTWGAIKAVHRAR